MTRRVQPLSPLTLTIAFLCLMAIPTAAQTTLQRGRTVSGTLAVGDTARYAIDLDDDYFVYGEVNQLSVDVIVRILDPDGQQISRTDQLGRGAERFAGRSRGRGVHEIQIIPDDEQSGDFTITLHRVEPVESDPRRLADQLMARYDGDDSPGGVVHVWRDGRVLFSKAYGMANLAYGIPFETDTRTNIGSTSKQFTAFAILLQAERGLLSLDDDIRKHIPELPTFDRTITVRHLITHTSGLREFVNLLLMAGRRFDRGDWIDRSEVIEIVQRQPTLQNEPGAEFNYNNTAFALAAVIVERTSGKDFHVFMRENVFGPLRMTHTMVRPTNKHIVPNNSEGYAPGDEGFLQVGDVNASTGAGGIYSTVEDLQTWVQNFANPTVGSPAMIRQMMTPNVLQNGDSTGYGYGLFIDEQGGLQRVHHGGSDLAHRSQLAYFPEINAGITTQSNHAGFSGGIAFQLAGAFFKDAMQAQDEGDGEEGGQAEFDAASYDVEGFDDFVGRYALDAAPTFVLTFSRDGETLYMQATGQPQVEIVPTSDSTFALTVVEASITFHFNDEGEVHGATLHQNGDNHATRLDDSEEVTPWEPSAAGLNEFVGRYYSAELETFYTFTVENDTLVLQHRRLDDAHLEPGDDPDTFSSGIMSYAFERDRNGVVIGFYLANGRTRDVRFQRVR